MDIWVLLPLMYNNSKAHVAEVLKKGDAVWSYNTLVQDAYSPKWLIDFRPGQLPHPAGLYQSEPQPDRIALLADRQMAFRRLEQRKQRRHL